MSAQEETESEASAPAATAMMTATEEAQAVLDLEAQAASTDPVVGEALYAISNKWFSQFCQYSSFVYDSARKKARVVPQQEPGPRPGPIDNGDLVAEPPSTSDLSPEQQLGVVRLRDKLIDKFDVWMVHEPTWNLLKEWYGCQGPEVRREYHYAGKRVQLDAQQHHFRVIAQYAGEDEQQETIVGCSAMCTLSNLKEMACAAMKLEADDYDIYDFQGRQQGANLEPTIYKTLTGVKLQDQQALLLVPRKQQQGAALEADAAKAGVPSSPMLMLPATTSPLRLDSARGGSGLLATSPLSPLSRSFDRIPHWAEDVIYEAPGRARGLAGLGNLGNTCFMNSSLQCLAHSMPLMQTFLTGAYKHDLNKDNPLSLGGKLALAFASLMDKLWRGNVGHVSPKKFKWHLAAFAPQFSGYSQQDSHELLSFLLDGLHEDLNRVTEKPYIEDKDSDGRPDEEVAAEAWRNYRLRNDSGVVDSFQGLLRSVLTCPTNPQHQSTKFDPFMYLTLELPSSKMRSLIFTAVYVDGSVAPRQYGIELPKSATVGQLYVGMAELLGVATDTATDVLLLTQFSMSDASFAVYTDLQARISSIEDFRSRGFFNSRGATHLYIAYIYPSPNFGPRSGKHPVQIYHRARGSRPEWPIPATPLFISEEQLAALSTELQSLDDGSEAPPEGPDTINAILEQMLRPFRRPQAPLPAAQQESMFDSSSVEQEEQQLQGHAIMDESPSSVDGEASGGEAAMEVEQDGPCPDSPTHPVEADAPFGGVEAWLETSPANGIQEDAPGPSAASPVPMASVAAEAQDAGEVFDMWSAQKHDAAMADAAAAAAAASSPPFLLRAAKRTGYNLNVSTYNVKFEVPEDGQPLLLVADWQDAAGHLYDPLPLLDAEKDGSALALAAKLRDGGKSVTLAECLEAFLQPELLDADDKWYCGKCKQHVQAEKKLDLWSLPDVVVIFLKRFTYSRKLTDFVSFPLRDLDMTPYLRGRQQNAAQQQEQQQQQYDLFAVSNHFGGMGGGHYTAYCRMPGASGGWYIFDDSSVGAMEESGVQSSAAYVLFYRRQGAQDEDVEALLARAAAEEGDAAPLLPSTSKRHPEAIDEQEEQEQEEDLVPAAGDIDID